LQEVKVIDPVSVLALALAVEFEHAPRKLVLDSMTSRLRAVLDPLPVAISRGGPPVMARRVVTIRFKGVCEPGEPPPQAFPAYALALTYA
jgi:hypothetical protein